MTKQELEQFFAEYPKEVGAFEQHLQKVSNIAMGQVMKKHKNLNPKMTLEIIRCNFLRHWFDSYQKETVAK